MRISSQLNKLKEKIEKQRKQKKEAKELPMDELKFKVSDKMHEKEHEKVLSNKLKFLKNLLKMIENGASGFDLAYELEKKNSIKRLIYDGIMFYNTFLEIGDQTFLKAPDKKRVDYRAFRTVEDTEKYLFMIWLKESITNLEKEINPQGDYDKYRKAREKAPKRLKQCKNCGAKIKDNNQKFCEICGSELI
ncbi:MAG: zinc ribbon domain-containing protein [Promethearchaeota archaeon]